jgi:hypothetical protein
MQQAKPPSDQPCRFHHDIDGIHDGRNHQTQVNSGVNTLRQGLQLCRARVCGYKQLGSVDQEIEDNQSDTLLPWIHCGHISMAAVIETSASTITTNRG